MGASSLWEATSSSRPQVQVQFPLTNSTFLQTTRFSLLMSDSLFYIPVTQAGHVRAVLP